jgi:cytoskeletal protein CcmA (bactofilin family)
MKRMVRAVLLAIVVALAVPSAALAAGPQDGQVVFGGTFTLAAGQAVDGDLLVVGGVVTLEEGSSVHGDTVLFGGTISVDGEIDGSLAAMGGSVNVGPHAVIHGDLVRFGAVVSIDDSATIEGQVLSEQQFQLPPIDWNLMRPTFVPLRIWSYTISPVFSVLWFAARVLLLAALAVLVVMFWPEPTRRVALAIVEQPLPSVGIGVLTLLVAPALLLALVFTICLIPVSAIGFVVFGAAAVFGVLALGLEVGQRIALMFRWEIHPAAAAGIGTLVLAALLGGLAEIPCIGLLGLLAIVAVISVGLGAVVLTRFGSRLYPPAGGAIAPAGAAQG